MAAELPRLGRNLTHGLLDALGRGIVTGEFHDAGFPTEADLARRFAVSRSVTREAVKMLTAKGLLSARPRQGTSVQPEDSWNLFDPDVLRWLLERKFTLSLLRQFTELRVAIEPAAAELAARAATAEERALIEAGYQRMADAEAGRDDALEADIAFHVAIMRASRNPFFAQFRDVVGTALRKSIRFTNRFKGRTARQPPPNPVRRAKPPRATPRAPPPKAQIKPHVMLLIADAERGDHVERE